MHDRVSPNRANQQSQPTAVSSIVSPLTHFASNPDQFTLGVGRDFSQIAIRQSSPVALLPKLRIDPVDSPLEREADRVAEAVMRSPDNNVNVSTGSSSRGIQRKCDTCKHEKDDDAELSDEKRIQRSPSSTLATDLPIVQRKCANCEEEEDKEKTVHRAKNCSSSTFAPHLVNQVISQPGRSLPSSTRDFFESRMNADFSNVRIHDNSQAAESASAVNAKAYTVGNSIAFASGQYAPQSESGQFLLAHELTHVVQQAGGDSLINRAADTVKPAEERSLFERAGDLIGSAAYSVTETAKDGAIWVVRKVSPELANIIEQGPSEYIKGLVHGSITEWLTSLPGVGNLMEIAGNLAGSFEASVSLIVGALKGDAGNACASFAQLLSSLSQLARSVMENPVVQMLQQALGAVSSAINKVVSFVAAEAFEHLAPILGGAWRFVSGAASKIWGWLGKIKDISGDAAEWVGKKLGLIGEDGEEGIFAWIKRKANEVWTSLKSTFAPIIEPIQKVAKIALLLSPLGPIYALLRYGPKVVSAIQWLWENRDDPDLIQKSREHLSGTIFPQILEAASGFRDIFQSAVAWFVSSVTDLSKSLLEFAGSLTGVPLLEPVNRLVATVTNGVNALAEIGKSQLQIAADWLTTAANKVINYIKPYQEVLTSVGLAIAAPPMIPVILMGWAWQALPGCVRVPIINFILDILISTISTLGELPMLGPLWTLFRPGVISFLTEMRAAPAEQKEAVALNIAKILRGSNLGFMIGFAKGVLVGIWESVIDPIKAIWTVVQGLSSIVDYLENLAGNATGSVTSKSAALGSASPNSQEQSGERIASIEKSPMETPTHANAREGATASEPTLQDLAPEVSSLAKDTRPDVQIVLANFWTDVQAYFQGSEGVTYEQLSTKLGELWSTIQGKIAELGGELAKHLMNALSAGAEADRGLGEKLGSFVGMFAMDAILAFFTAGLAAEAKVAAELIQRFINWPMEMLGKAFKLLAQVGRYIWDGLKGIGRFAKAATKDALGAIARKLIAFAERMMAKFGSRAAGAGVNAAEREAAQLAERKLLGTGERKLAGEAEKDVLKVAEGAESQAAREASVAESGRLESDKLSPKQVTNEIDDIAAHAERIVEVPPPRRVQVGNHTWIEHEPGRWCRHSTGEFCIIPSAEEVAILSKSKELAHATSTQTLSLHGNWRATKFPADTDGIVYILRDAETGELLKVGKSEVANFSGRFAPYQRAGVRTNRNLEADVFTIRKGASKSMESVEGEIRTTLLEQGHSLQWDNTVGRLGRPGPGVPGSSLPKKLRADYRWNYATETLDLK